MFQIWKTNGIGSMPDCMHRISNTVEHSGRLLGNYVAFDWYVEDS